MAPLEGMTIGILAADGSEQIEVTAPRAALTEAGATARVLTPGGDDVRGYHYIEPGDMIPADGDIDEADAADLDALVIPGGLGGPDTLRKDPAVIRLVRDVAAAGTPLGVICHGPWLLVDAGALSGTSLTCVPQLRTEVTLAGAHYVDEDVHVHRTDGKLLVSSRDHNTAQEFGEALVREFATTRP